jgi:uncharacterized OB-fold protein
MMDSKICPNCKNDFVGNYCSDCGQKYLKVPFDFKNLYSIITEWVDFNKGFVFTFYVCYFRPGRLIREYLSGATKRYFGPIKFLIVLVGLEYAILFIGHLISGWMGNSDFSVDESGIDANPKVVVFYVYLLVFNFVVFKSSFLIVEHLIISAYQFLALFVLSGLLTYTLALFNVDTNTILTFALLFSLVLGYTIWFNVEVFKNSYLITIVKSILCIVGSVGLFIMVIKLS